MQYITKTSIHARVIQVDLVQFRIVYMYHLDDKTDAHASHPIRQKNHTPLPLLLRSE
jgi:hypothetical protein